jgi:hypothetical protein
VPEAASSAALPADRRAYHRLGAPERYDSWQRRGRYDEADGQHRLLNDGSERRRVKIFGGPAALPVARCLDAHIDATSLVVSGLAPPRG